MQCTKEIIFILSNNCKKKHENINLIKWLKNNYGIKKIERKFSQMK